MQDISSKLLLKLTENQTKQYKCDQDAEGSRLLFKKSVPCSSLNSVTMLAGLRILLSELSARANSEGKRSLAPGVVLLFASPIIFSILRWKNKRLQFLQRRLVHNSLVDESHNLANCA